MGGMNVETSKKVLHVVPGFGSNGTLGGAERAVYDIVRGLARSGAYAPILCVLRRAAPPADLELEGIEVLTLHFTGPDRDFELLTRCAGQLRAMIKRIQPALVHSHLWTAAAVSGCALKGLGIPHVIHIHDTRSWLISKQLRHRVRRALNRWMLGRSVRFIACAKAVRDFTRDRFLPSADIEVIHYGIDAARFIRPGDRPAPGNAGRTVGTAARLRPEKGLEALLAACRQVHDEGLAFRLKVAGGGRRLAYYREEVQRAGLSGVADFLGPVADMPSFFSGLDVFVLPSLATEGLPISMLEAMASELPVVATAIAGTPEAVTDGEEGFMVPPNDIPALAAAMKKLLSDPPRAREMGRKARARIERFFARERMVEGVLRYYDTIPGLRNRAGS